MKLSVIFVIAAAAILANAIYLPMEFQFDRLLSSFTAPAAQEIPSLSDLLTLQRGSLFYDYIREDESIVSYLAVS